MVLSNQRQTVAATLRPQLKNCQPLFVFPNCSLDVKDTWSQASTDSVIFIGDWVAQGPQQNSLQDWTSCPPPFQEIKLLRNASLFLQGIDLVLGRCLQGGSSAELEAAEFFSHHLNTSINLSSWYFCMQKEMIPVSTSTVRPGSFFSLLEFLIHFCLEGFTQLFATNSSNNKTGLRATQSYLLQFTSLDLTWWLLVLGRRK